MRNFFHLFDEAGIRLISRVPDWMVPFMHFFSTIGHPFTTISVLICIGIYSLAVQNIRLIVSTCAMGGVFILNSVFKIIIGRERRSNDYVESMVLDTFSFPSGHTAGSTLAFGLLAYVLFHILPQPFGIISCILLGIIVVGVGVSRIYLGAHYPTDVAAGWLLGLLGLAVVIWIIRPFA